MLLGGSRALSSALGAFLILFCGFGASRCWLGLFYVALDLLGVLCFSADTISFPVLSSSMSYGALRFVVADILFFQFFAFVWVVLYVSFLGFYYWVGLFSASPIGHDVLSVLCVCCFGKHNRVITSFC